MKCVAVILFASYVPTVLSCALPLDNLQVHTQHRFPRDLTTNCGPQDEIPPNRVNTSIPLKKLRVELLAQNISVYIVPLDEENRLKWISGFGGSSGIVALTMEQALLWTDGRYFHEAADVLDCNWTLMKMGVDGTPSIDTWIIEELSKTTQVGASNKEPGAKSKQVGADPRFVGADQWIQWKDKFSKAGVELVETKNLIDEVWTQADGRPTPQYKSIVVHPLQWAGEEWQSKVVKLRDALAEQNYSAMLVTELDEIAWVFNLRGEGESNLGLFDSPLFESLALVSREEVVLWIHTEKLSEEGLVHLRPEHCGSTYTCVQVLPLENSTQDLKNWFERQRLNESVLLSAASSFLSGANYEVYSAVPPNLRKLAESPILVRKAIKNKVEEEGMMNAHVKDALALCAWAAQMELEVQVLERNWTEISAASLLLEYRLQQQDVKGVSFHTISAFGSNGAIIHYSPAESTNKQIDRSSLFLVDSGGQYLDGTTDVTRTFHYGTPTPEQIERYTDVLRGAIQLAMVQVPENTLDTSIDLVTRQFLYRHGLEYRHGTGHGIGAYLKVHEGPTRITMKRDKPEGLKVGMFFSDEPGYYKEGEYGIRLETILKVVEMPLEKPEYGHFIEFEPVTLVPFEPKLINYDALSREEIHWMNMYNKLIEDKVAKRFEESGNTLALDWVRERTKLIV